MKFNKNGHMIINTKRKKQKLEKQLENLPPFKNSSIYEAIKLFENSSIYKTLESIKPQLELYKEISRFTIPQEKLAKFINLQEIKELQKISKILSRNINTEKLKEYAIKTKMLAYKIRQNENQDKPFMSQPELQLPLLHLTETINKGIKTLIKNTKPLTFKNKVINTVINYSITTIITIVTSIAIVIITIIYRLF